MFSEVIALDFDLTCTTRLMFYDLQKEKRMAEMFGMGQMTEALGGMVPAGFDTSKANYH